MENLQSNFLEIEDLKKLILGSNEYKNYSLYLELVRDDDILNKDINEIKRLQKILIQKKYNKEEINDIEKELSDLNKKIYSNNNYKKYIESSKKLNILLSDIATKFNDYFDSLVSKKNSD